MSINLNQAEINATLQASKNDVLYAFSVELNRDINTLACYLKRYPQYREALIDLSIELFMAPKLDEVAAESVPGDKCKQAWSNFQSLLNPNDPASAPSALLQKPYEFEG